jgi:apolipoprotein D and lipocalin family protein
MKKTIVYLTTVLLSGCSSGSYNKTVDQVEILKFMGKWYVLGGRFTFLEKNVHNAVESYVYNIEKDRIDIQFSYNQDSLDGKLKQIPQTAWIENKKSNAHWKVSPMWPLKFDYLVIDLADDYSWTAIGVPSEKYLWIMAKDWRQPEVIMEKALKSLGEKGYNIQDIVLVPHRH